MIEILSKTGFVTQEFILSPVQFGVPYSRPRYFCLVNALLVITIIIVIIVAFRLRMKKGMEVRVGFELDKSFLLKIRVIIEQVMKDAGMSLNSGLMQGLFVGYDGEKLL